MAKQAGSPQRNDLNTQVARPRPRRLVVVGLLLVSMLALLGSAPTLLSRRDTTQWILAQLVPPETVTISVQAIEIGWFSRLIIHGLRVADAKGTPILEVPTIKSNRTLWEFVNSRDDLGELILDSPTVHIELTSDGSNLEDTFSRLRSFQSATTNDPSSSTSGMGAVIRVVDGRVVARTFDGHQSWSVDEVNAQLAAPASSIEPWHLTIRGKLEGAPFAMDASVPLGLSTNDQPLGPDGNLLISAESLSIAPLGYIANRMGVSVDRLSGGLTTKTQVSWSVADSFRAEAVRPVFKISTNFDTRGFELASESLFPKDTLVLRELKLDAAASVENDLLDLEQCTLRTDLGSFSLSTSDVLCAQDRVSLLQALRNSNLTCDGHIDVAALTAALPNTLRIRDDVQMTGGRAVWNIKSERTSKGSTRWTGELRTQDVLVEKAEQPIDLDFPLELTFAVLDGHGWEIESLTGRSDFFSLTGSGTLRNGTLHASVDPERLVFELSQIMDISDIYVRGQAQVAASWEETVPNELQLQARADLTQFVMTQNERILCQEDEFSSSLTATASINERRVVSLNEAKLHASSPQNALDVRLQLDEPVRMDDAESQWALLGRVDGNLSNWSSILKPLGIGLDWQLAGRMDATSRLTASRKTVSFSEVTAEIQGLSAESETWNIREPIVQLRAAGMVDLDTGRIRIPEAQLATQTVSMSTRDLDLSLWSSRQLRGDFAFRTNLDRVTSSLRAPSNQLTGQATGRIRLRSESSKTRVDLTAEADDLQMHDTRSGDLVWTEPKLTLTGEGVYDASSDRLSIDKVAMRGAVVHLQGEGDIVEWRNGAAIDFRGEYGYDLQTLMPVLRPLLGSNAQLAGAQRHPFSIQGPLVTKDADSRQRVSPQLEGQARFGWDSATVYDVPMGPAAIDASLSGGVVKIHPLQLDIGGGQAWMASILEMNTQPLWMTFDQRTRLEQIRITPEMTSTWLKYLAPMIADTTQAKGTFSLTCSRAKVALIQPSGSQVEGQLIIHGGVVGPGPLATQFIEIANQVKQITGGGSSRVADPTQSWVELLPQQVRFQIADNRVFHDKLQMVVDGVPIHTRGSVGLLDETISVEADVAIPSHWVASSALDGLSGQTVTIPIRGTVTRPILDRRSLAQVNARLVQQAAGGVIQRELSSRLDDKVGEFLKDGIGIDRQSDLGSQLQNEFGKQLNRLFK